MLIPILEAYATVCESKSRWVEEYKILLEDNITVHEGKSKNKKSNERDGVENEQENISSIKY